MRTDTHVVTVNGRERLASPGGGFTNWDGWSLVYAGDIPSGYHVRLGGRQFPAVVEPTNHDVVRVREEGVRLPPHVIWKGCLVWTYLGSH
jgi:hypothetical protein